MGLFSRLFPKKARMPDNSHLIRAMEEVSRNDGPDTRRALYTELKKSTLLAVMLGPPANITGKEGGDGKQAVAILYGEDGISVFTDAEQVKKWKPEGGPLIALTSQALFNLCRRLDLPRIFINPGGPVSGWLERSEIDALAPGDTPIGERMIEGNLQRGEEFLVGSPAPNRAPPEELVQIFRRELERTDDVEFAYLFMMATERAGSGLALGIHFNRRIGPRRLELLGERLMKDALQYIPQGEFIDILELNDPGMLKSLESGMKPIYRRK